MLVPYHHPETKNIFKELMNSAFLFNLSELVKIIFLIPFQWSSTFQLKNPPWLSKLVSDNAHALNDDVSQTWPLLKHRSRLYLTLSCALRHTSEIFSAIACDDINIYCNAFIFLTNNDALHNYHASRFHSNYHESDFCLPFRQFQKFRLGCRANDSGKLRHLRYRCSQIGFEFLQPLKNSL